MTEIQYAPTFPSRIVTIGAGSLAFLTALSGAPSSVAVALLGASTLALGVLIGARVAVDAGAGLLFLGVVLAAAFTSSPAVPLVGAVATVVAWDAADNGISLGNQLGQTADTRRLEAIHSGATLVVGLVAATASYAVFIFAAGNQPLPALILLLFAAVVLTATLRD